jgi:phosphate transport system permease protein
LKVTAWFCLLIPIVSFLSIIWDLITKSQGGLTLEFLTLPPVRAGKDGGIFPILVSTFYVVTMSLAISLPPALGCALLISDRQSIPNSLVGSMCRYVSVALDSLTGVPSIVFGIVGNALFCRYFEFGYSILAGSLTLGLMIWPYMTRAFEETFNSIPKDIYHQSLSLGISSYTYFSKIILRHSIPGLSIGVVLALSRAIAETSALLFTSGYSDRLPESLMDSGRVISIHILDLAMNVTGGEQNAHASGLALLIFLLVINSVFGSIFNLYRNVLR